VQGIEAANRTAYESAIGKLHQRFFRYVQLKNAVQTHRRAGLAAELATYEALIPQGIAAAQAQQSGKAFDQTNFAAFAANIQRFQFMANLEPPLILPPNGSTDWRRMGDALLDAPRGTPVDNSIRDYAKMAGALAANQPAVFNARPARSTSSTFGNAAEGRRQSQAETFFNQMQPFYQCDGHLRPRRLARNFFVVQFV